MPESAASSFCLATVKVSQRYVEVFIISFNAEAGGVQDFTSESRRKRGAQQAGIGRTDSCDGRMSRILADLTAIAAMMPEIGRENKPVGAV